jgi:hypothetical protein
MKPQTQRRVIRVGIAVLASVAMLAALGGVVMAAPGGTRPGWGCGDDNHVHTGPRGRGSSEGNPCQNEQNAPHEQSIHLVLAVAGSTAAGSAFNLTVTAVDPNGNTLTSFGDTVHFSSSDNQASLPVDTTLTNGTGTFGATLRTAGNQTITASDASNSSVQAGSGTIAVSPLVATHLTVSTPTNVSANVGFTVTVTAQDEFNNTATSFGDTVHFTGSDGSASLPVDSTLSSGTGTFTATLRTVGNQTITATDTSNGSINGTSAAIGVS